jgi:hypothetical protein
MPAEARARDGLADVLALKAIPALANAHPDDLIGLALRAAERRAQAGAALAPGEPSLLLLVEGRVAERAQGRTLAVHEAPALPGLLAALAGDAGPELVAESDAVALEVARPALVEVLEEEFELCVALLREVCRCALAAGAGPLGGAPLPGARAARFDPDDLAGRIVLLRGAPPFAELPIALLGQLAAALVPVEAAGGERLWDGDEPALRMLAIAAGVVELEGGPGRLGPGALPGLLETLAGGAYGRRLRAQGPVRALALPGEALLDALEDEPASAVELLCALARHARGGSR